MTRPFLLGQITDLHIGPTIRAACVRRVVRMASLSRSGRMWVYVSSGTGTRGPPVRFGSEPELTLIRLSGKAV